jgi:excisionase family DNA binding protein
MVLAMTDERLLTVREVAARLQVTEFTVRTWLKSGRLHGYLPGGRKMGWRVRPSELDRFLESTAPDAAS